MKKLIFVVCMALGLAACGGGGGSSSDTAGPSADALKAKVAVPDPTLAAQAISVVNTTIAGDQVFRAVGALTDGGYTVAWSSGSSTTFQRYDSAGTKVGDEVSVPVVGAAAVLSDGGVVVVREPVVDLTLHTSAVSVSLFDASGALVRQIEVASGPSFALFPETFLTNEVDVAPLANGGFVVGWEVGFAFLRSSSREAAVLTQRYDGQGAPIGGPIQIAGSIPRGAFTTFVGTAPAISLTPDAQGGYTATVAAGRVGGIPGGFTWTVVHVDANGTATQIVGETAGTVVLLPLEGDRFVRFTTAPGPSPTVGQMLDRAGNPVGDPIPIAGMPFAAKELVDGSFVVFWNTDGNAAAQRFSSNGVPVGNLLTLGISGAVPTLPDGGFAEGVAPLADGGFAAAWSAPSTAGDFDVFTQRFIEVLTLDQAALRAKRKACLAGAKGMAGQERKAFMDACLQA